MTMLTPLVHKASNTIQRLRTIWHILYHCSVPYEECRSNCGAVSIKVSVYVRAIYQGGSMQKPEDIYVGVHGAVVVG